MLDAQLLWLGQNLLQVLLPLIFVMGFISALTTKALVKFSLQAIPNARSAHQQPTPTAGGFALMLAVGAGLILLTFIYDVIAADLLVLLGLSSLAMVLGFVDDFREISAKLKFSLIGFLSLIMAYLLGPVMVIPFDEVQLQLPWVLGMAGTGLFVFTLINSVNFIDGADGVIPLSALVAAIAMAIIGVSFEVWTVVFSSLLLIFALVGFLPFNMPQAKIFLGDTGSLFIGTWLAGTALILIASGPEAALWLMPLLFMPWLSDVLLTMAWRLRHKQNLLTAHNDHLYQWMIRGGKSHLQVALALSAQIAITGILAIVFSVSPTSAFLGFVATASFALLVHLRVRSLDKRQIRR